ncbi:MAG: MFS transporter [Clostridiales bacterium]|nr:MFS transporter [Clostridiales bacterium]
MQLSKPKLFLFGFAAIGVNLLNLIMGVYLCHSLYIPPEGGSFIAFLGKGLGKNLVIPAVWAIVITISKIVDGIIDIPLANLLDNLKAKFGKRKTGMILGFVPMAVSFILFLIALFPNATGTAQMWGNTIWFGFFLILFYCSYTCTMLAYYACFSEVTRDDDARRFLSNVKSVADVVSYVLAYALIPILIDATSIRSVGLIFLPISLLIVIAMFMLRGETDQAEELSEKEPNMLQSLVHAFKRRDFMLWMCVNAFMTFAIQFFLVGQPYVLSEIAQFSGGQIALMNACAFGPVPFTIMLCNHITKRRGFRFGFVYSMLTFSLGMGICSLLGFPQFLAGINLNPLYVGIAGALVCSLGIGTFFSVTYIIPSHVAAREREEQGISQPSMYFAVQGLFGAVVTAFSTGLIFVNMRNSGYSQWMMPVVGIALVLCSALTVILPKSIAHIGKVNRRQADAS